MHLADGVLRDLPLLVSLNLAGAGAVGYALARVGVEPRRGAAWVGTLSAFVLALQALNVPLLPGASAHAVGASLLALVLGPSRAVVALTAVLLVQAVLLGDGGITVVGLNAFHLAVLPVVAVVAVRRVAGPGWRGAQAAAWIGTPLGALLGALSLGLALIVGAGAPSRETFLWLLGVQGLSGLLEGGLTALAVARLRRHAPDLIEASPSPGPRALDEAPASAPRGARWAAVAVAVALGLLPFASDRPDPLERVLGTLPGAGSTP